MFIRLNMLEFELRGRVKRIASPGMSSGDGEETGLAFGSRYCYGGVK